MSERKAKKSIRVIDESGALTTVKMTREELKEIARADELTHWRKWATAVWVANAQIAIRSVDGVRTLKGMKGLGESALH